MWRWSSLHSQAIRSNEKAVERDESKWSCLAAASGANAWGNPAGRVDTPASPALPLEGAGRGRRDGV